MKIRSSAYLRGTGQKIRGNDELRNLSSRSQGVPESGFGDSGICYLPKCQES